MVYHGPKARQCRREGVNLFGSPKYTKLMGRKPGVPGMHGGKRMAKMTEYARQLREKQKMKRMYGVSEKQFRNYFDKATRSKAVTGDALSQLLERRLDNVLYRAGLALTRAQGRQMSTHGMFLVNGRRTDVPSFQVSVGDKIEVRPSKKGSSLFVKVKESLQSHTVPAWLNVDDKNIAVEIMELPDERYFDGLIESRLIVEFYSR